jgi:predicted branched-subunit amino acid permease
VNLRFVVFSLHMREYLMHLPRWRRMAMGYYVTDNTYVFFTKRFAHAATRRDEQWTQEAYLSGMSGANWLCWIGASLVGIALANFIPAQWGLGFAGILCLLGVQCSLASSRLRILAAVVAAAVSVAVYALPYRLNIVIAIAAAVMAGIMIENLQRQLQGART